MSNLPFFLRPVPSGNGTSGGGPLPPMFSLLCILSFIGSGLSAFLYFFMAVYYHEIAARFESGEVVVPGLELFMTGGLPFFLLESLLNALAFTGVVLMWKRKVIGFHFYMAAQIFLLMVPVAFLEGRPFMAADAFISGAFVLLYYLQLRRLGLFNANNAG